MATVGDVIGSAILVARVGRSASASGIAFWQCQCLHGHLFHVRIDKLKYSVKVKKEPCPKCRDEMLLRTCRYCGTRQPNAVAAVVCCLFAPPPTGWCAWCGGDCRRTFCDDKCAKEYLDDEISMRRRL